MVSTTYVLWLLAAYTSICTAQDEEFKLRKYRYYCFTSIIFRSWTPFLFKNTKFNKPFIFVISYLQFTCNINSLYVSSSFKLAGWVLMGFFVIVSNGKWGKSSILQTQTPVFRIFDRFFVPLPYCTIHFYLLASHLKLMLNMVRTVRHLHNRVNRYKIPLFKMLARSLLITSNLYILKSSNI